MRFKALAVGLLTGAALLLGAGSASAHAALISVDPADQSTVDTGPAEVSLTFNEAISPSFAAVTVVGPDNNLWSKGDAVVDGSTVAVQVGDLGPVGEYKVAYRVTSADGHVVEGVRSFTLSQEGSGTPGKSVAVDVSESTDYTLWFLIGGAGLAFVVALAFALRRPKRD